MNASVRPLLVPAIALAAAGTVALGPALVAPPALSVAQPSLPSVRVADVQLAGIGQEIYYAITPWVQYGVELVQYAVEWIPVIGPPISDQIDINYFRAIQPAVEATVNYLAAVVQDPFNFIAETGAYGNQLYGIGYNWVVAQFNFFFPWLPPIPPLPLASVAAPVSAASFRVSPAATLVEPVTEAPAEPVVAPEPIAEPVVPEVVAIPEPVEVPEVSPVVDPAPEAPAVTPEPRSVEAPEAAPVSETTAAPESAAPAADQTDRPARASRAEARGAGKAARATRGPAE